MEKAREALSGAAPALSHGDTRGDAVPPRAAAAPAPRGFGGKGAAKPSGGFLGSAGWRRQTAAACGALEAGEDRDGFAKGKEQKKKKRPQAEESTRGESDGNRRQREAPGGRRTGRTRAGQSQCWEGKSHAGSDPEQAPSRRGVLTPNTNWGLLTAKPPQAGEPQGAAKPPGRAGAILCAGWVQIRCRCGRTTSVNSFWAITESQNHWVGKAL